MMDKKGLVIINTGNGKGKSTASFGMAVRAVGNGMKVVIRQFIKGTWTPGEVKAFKQLSEFVDLKTLGKGFIEKPTEAEIQTLKIETSNHLKQISKEIITLKPQMLILDEIIYLLSYGLCKEDELIDFIKKKPDDLHLILTGRGATDGIIEVADLVTEMKEIKHPYHAGVSAQKGVEY